jgi:hypothetical protein
MTKPTRGEERAQRRDQRQAEFWAERRAAATTPSAQSHLAYQGVRTRIRKLPASEQVAAWRLLTGLLDGLVPDPYSHANFARPSANFEAPTHTGGARGRDPRARVREAAHPEGARS